MSFGERPQDPSYGGQPAGPQQPPGGYPLQPGMPVYGGARRDNSTATVALVLGLLPLITGLLVVSPFAWWQGNKALAEIDAAPDVYGNRGMAVAGRITGIVGTVLLGLVVLALVAGLVVLLFFVRASDGG